MPWAARAATAAMPQGWKKCRRQLNGVSTTNQVISHKKTVKSDDADAGGGDGAGAAAAAAAAGGGDGHEGFQSSGNLFGKTTDPQVFV